MRRWLAVVAVVAAGCSAPARPAAAPPSISSAASTSTTAPPPRTPQATSAAAPTAGPCAGASPPATYQHVVVIVMENRGLTQVDGSRSAPYVNGLGRQCGLATDYAAVSHPSLPNYIALTSGSTHGITDDAGPGSHPLRGPSIFSLLGAGWRSLQESMPVPCDHSSGGEYATKHNPAVYYAAIAAGCPSQDVAMADQAPDISARYTLITPNLCNDGHDCSTSTADHWLSGELPLILNSSDYRSGGTVVFITWDEDDSGRSLVPTYVISPSVPPALRVAAPFSHYSLLRTTEELLGLTPLLGAAAAAPSMRDAFHL